LTLAASTDFYIYAVADGETIVSGWSVTTGLRVRKRRASAGLPVASLWSVASSSLHGSLTMVASGSADGSIRFLL
jgi:hypothetical protein